MDIEQVLKAMTPEIYDRLCYAVETGKWPDGTSLNQAQRDQALQAVMLYQSRHNSQPQHMTVAKGGQVTWKSKAELKREFAGQDGQRIDIETKH
ncbi:hypothetical protein BZG78_05920 [Salinivibrio sp. MA351]|uniref:DUF1315 family protein n=1 Tax=Salinivibrio costicola subsp. alcaliphilus TaxID=272773 RepID=A0ABX3KSA5_SALCS|nr:MULTISPECIES: DUF1315 family protein [Salinivibrio]NUY56390.1 DUF1315 family protein [Salinivibrio sp. EAGSL]OOE93357.1 hypothetical protein BZG76_04980 [Salinivibrio sp. AR647]OOE94883.1 hypothetical protein BZG75_04555 [Salinivibrio sp. AR640]OOE99964.1 hypothetical protein BZG78_05920 [Salinivibrio sp. MA351]OOF06402.1 hypothetical protein BZG81_03245 [Salinivibrio sp. MA607]